MGSDEMIYIKADAAAVQAAGYASQVHHGWQALEVARKPETLAVELSRALGTTAVWASLSTSAEQVWIRAFERGQQVRELLYTDGKWRKSGALAGEAKALGKWLRTKWLHAGSDGYDVIDCVLGADEPPVDELADDGATQALFLPGPLVSEASHHARANAVTLSRVLIAGWQLGKHRLYERELVDRDPNLDDLGYRLVAPPPGVAEPALVHEARDPAPLPTSDRKVKCGLALPAEIVSELRTLAMSLDRTLSWTVVEAYVLARPELA